MSWLKEDRFGELYDFTPNEIRSKIQRHIWQKGIHYAVIDRRRRFNTEAIDPNGYIKKQLARRYQTPRRQYPDTLPVQG